VKVVVVVDQRRMESILFGYEINEGFLPIIKQKLGMNQGIIFQDATF